MAALQQACHDLDERVVAVAFSQKRFLKEKNRYATAVELAADLAGSRYMEEVAAGLRRDSVEVSLSEASE